MAYSDYGGYAFLNGVLVKERCDVLVGPDGFKATPGIYPGFVHPYDPTSSSQRIFHVLLGDGPTYIGLYKQFDVVLLNEDIWSFADPPIPDSKYLHYDGGKFIDVPSAFLKDINPTRFVIGEDILEVLWVNTDNYYILVRLTQRDGNVWSGFSGYGVGMGLEDVDYGFSTHSVQELLFEVFPV